MSEVTASPLFGIVISVAAFEVGLWLNKKTKSPLCNPLLIAIILVVLVLQLFHIPAEDYQKGGDVISVFLAPATAVLALSVYSQLELLKKHLLPVLAGCVAGAISSIVSVFLMCRAFGLDAKITASLLPKSVTAPIAMELSRQHGGYVAVTMAAVMITGIFGAVFAPLLVRLLHVTDPVAQGVAIGAASHAMGTTKAVELGETQGAMSGVAIGVCGVATVLLALLLF